MQKIEVRSTERADELDSFFQTSLSAMYLGEVIRDEENKVVDLRFLRVNKKFLTMFGFTEHQLLNTSLLTLSPPTRHTNFIEVLATVIETGLPRQETLFYPQQNQWFEFSMVRLDRNKVAVTFADITPLKEKTTLLDNILRYSAAGISVGLVIRDETGKIIDGKPLLANDAAFVITGISRELYFSKTSLELEPNLLSTEYYQKIVYTMETGQPSFVRYKIESTGKWIELTLSRMDYHHLIIVFNDITEAMISQQRQERLLEDLKRSNAALEEFTRAASHDLKEPIRKIQFFSQQLHESINGKLTAEEKQTLERVERSAARMKLLVDDLLDYAHVETNGQQKEEIDLNLKIKLILTDLELMVQEKKAHVTVGKLPVISGYRRQIQQLFQNLLTNSLKYHRPGVEPEIFIRCKKVTGKQCGMNVPYERMEEEFYLTEVEDNGIGFAQSDAERIFQVFTRLHGNVEYNGTGIGLSIVRKVVENHRGFIEAIGKPGEGAIFRVLLPSTL